MLRKSFVFAAIGMIIFSFASLASADVPHMINYQGKLTDAGGGLVNDTVQMTFSIYPDTLGSPAEWSETQAQVIVENGIFNVLLGAVDTIPSAVFDGNVKYLGVQVESDPEMTPLKPMVSVPYAYRAGSADGGGGGGGWVDDGTVVRLETETDQVGIGTASPEANLDVNDRIRVAGDWARIELLSSPNTVAGKISQDGNGHIKVAAPAGAGNVVLETQGTGRVNVKQNGTVYTHAASNVGIGTEWPEAHLHVDQPGIESDPIGVKVGPRWASGNPYNTGTQRVQIHAWSGSAGLSLAEHAVGGFLIGTDGPDLTIKEGHDGSGGERVRVTETGKVGIGISAPKAKLDVNGGIKGAPKTDSPSLSNALPLPDSVAYGVNASYSTDGGGMFAWYQGTSDHTDLAIWYGDDQNADLRFLRGSWDGTYQDLADVMTLAANGNVGIGTANPGDRNLKVYEQDNWPVYFRLEGNRSQTGSWANVIEFYAPSSPAAANRKNFTLVNRTPASAGGENVLEFRSSNDNGSNHVTDILTLSHSGTVGVKVLSITGGADLAEQFEIRQDGNDLAPKPGMVVCIDPENPGELAVSTKAYDPTVAGIISGAGDLKPGMLMGQKSTMADGEYPVALTGRVWCLADASYAPIKPGDFLTTSNTPGHAMKAEDRHQAYGAVIGKAMSSLDEGRGLVLVLVNLQ